MADIIFNQSKGRIVEFPLRVNNNDPTNSVLLVIPFNTSATDGTLRDLDTLAAVEADGNTAEATNSGASRKSLDQSAGITVTVDDTNDRTDVDIPDQTWTGVAASPGAWTDLLVAYDGDSTGGADSAIIPISLHDFAVTPDGSDITAQIGASGILRAA